MPQLTQYGTRRASRKPCDDVVVVDLDDAERRLRLRDGDRRGAAARPVRGEQRVEVDVDELVAVQREDVAAPDAAARGELDAAAATEPLGLLGGDDLGAEPAELALEELALPGGARDDHARRRRRARAGATW